MSRYRRADIPGATFFFTVVTYRRRSILCDDPVRAALRDAIKTVRSRHPFTVDAWVLLPLCPLGTTICIVFGYCRRAMLIIQCVGT